MFPKLLFFLVPAALFVVSLLTIAFWEGRGDSAKSSLSDSDTGGAFRAFYHVLWVLLLWSGLCLSLPLWVSYKEKILNAVAGGRWQLMSRVLVLPVVLLLLLWLKQYYLFCEHADNNVL